MGNKGRPGFISTQARAALSRQAHVLPFSYLVPGSTLAVHPRDSNGLAVSVSTLYPKEHGRKNRHRSPEGNRQLHYRDTQAAHAGTVTSDAAGRSGRDHWNVAD